ncbi:MAG TPA: hypothetical protein VM841_07770 [Actinomycetota bacterium]|nr:hypothetical protein [Actinomycetota bacterium]
MSSAHAAFDGSSGDAAIAAARPSVSPPPSRGGLVSLLAHDLRVPLGPLALATSSLAADPTIGGVAREYAQIAFVQSARVGRMMSAALAASGRLPSLRLARLAMVATVRAASDAFASLGGTMTVQGVEAPVTADATVLGECLLNMAELAAGGSMRTAATVDPGERVVVSFTCDDAGRCAAAFAKDTPDDADSAFALAAVAVAGAFGGLVEVTDGEIALVFPPAEDA